MHETLSRAIYDQAVIIELAKFDHQARETKFQDTIADMLSQIQRSKDLEEQPTELPKVSSAEEVLEEQRLERMERVAESVGWLKKARPTKTPSQEKGRATRSSATQTEELLPCLARFHTRKDREDCMFRFYKQIICPKFPYTRMQVSQHQEEITHDLLEEDRDDPFYDLEVSIQEAVDLMYANEGGYLCSSGITSISAAAMVVVAFFNGALLCHMNNLEKSFSLQKEDESQIVWTKPSTGKKKPGPADDPKAWFKRKLIERLQSVSPSSRLRILQETQQSWTGKEHKVGLTPVTFQEIIEEVCEWIDDQSDVSSDDGESENSR